MSSHKELNLKSIDVLEKYVILLSKEQDELFAHLKKIEDYDRHLNDYDEWNDKNHIQFSDIFFIKIQSNFHNLINSYEEAIARLNELKSVYSQI